LRVVVAMPAIALASAALYVIVVRTALAEGRVEGGTLALTLTGFVPGALMYGLQSALPIAARDARLGPILAERWHLVILGYAMAVIVLVAFLLVSVIGLA
jgi:hypothetical protein